MLSPLTPSPIVFLFVLSSAFVQLNLLFYKLKKEKRHQKTASYAGYSQGEIVSKPANC